LEDDSIISVYTAELIALAEKSDSITRLPNPDASARAVSPVCGSEVTVDFMLQGSKILQVGFASEACALTRAVLAVLYDAAPGKTGDDVLHAGKALKSMLENGGAAPTGDWEKLGLLQAVRHYPSRHNALLLPFEATARALALPARADAL